MAYNSDTDATAGYIGRDYKELLKVLAYNHGRNLRGELEQLIKQAAKRERLEYPSITVIK